MTRRRLVAGGWRHLILKSGIVTVALVLSARLFQIQVGHHSIYRAKAEAQWRRPVELEPERGNLYDRHGRPLALTVNLWRIGVATKVVANPREISQAVAGICGRKTREFTRRIEGARGRHVVLTQREILSREKLEKLRALPAVTLERLSERIYPLGGVGAALVGHYRDTGEGGELTTGLEHSLDATLSGTPGQAWRLAAGGQTDRSLGSVVLQEPAHGRHAVLTIDADLQAICEAELARSIEHTGAVGGSVLILDPDGCDVLAAASWPLLADRDRLPADLSVWNNFNFTGMYEPGSVFKIFTAAALLGHGAIDSTTVFDCTDGDFGAFRIRNSDGHSYGMLDFTEAFVQSSNIYFARAVANLDPEEFYRELTAFGFGRRTRFPYEAQAAGLLKQPQAWSGRSQSTIAIGQEVAVTPLQLAVAGCAIANGGILYAPRIVKEIRNHEDRLWKQCPPAPLYRVVSRSLAASLRRTMSRVVEEGTGRPARQSWIRLAGKTGTAQKSVDGRGYSPGKYVASFLGLVPADRPRLVVLTILDEPQSVFHYAAQSAVPLFGRIVAEIRSATEWLTDLTGDNVDAVPDTGRLKWVTVPDVLLLSRAAAAVKLHEAGLVAEHGARLGCVIEQVPAPGTACPRGEVVRLAVAADPAALQRPSSAPDLLGLSNRQVNSYAARLGLRVDIQGVGYVAEQIPRPGEPLPAGDLRVRMRSSW